MFAQIISTISATFSISDIKHYEHTTIICVLKRVSQIGHLQCLISNLIRLYRKRRNYLHEASL